MKKLDLKLDGKKKKWVLSIAAGVTAAAILGGIVFGMQGKGEPVGVYPFYMVGMTEFWGDSQESYGPVTTDKIQTVFLSDTQTVTEVLVSPGDTVKKGDVLLHYDTTLSELQLERKRLEVERAKLQVKEAEEQLHRIKQMTPMQEYVPPVIEENTDWGELLTNPYQILTEQTFDGSAPEKALVCWVKTGVPINNALLRELYKEAVTYQYANDQRENSSASDIPTEFTQPEATVTQPPAETTQPPEETTQPPAETTQPPEETTQPPEEVTEPIETEPTDPAVMPLIEETPEQPVIYSPHLLYSGATLTVHSGDAVNLTFINQAKGNATWSLHSKEGRELVGRPRELVGASSGKGFVVYGFPETVGIVEYTVKATEGNLESAFRFTLNVVEPEPEDKQEVNSFDMVLQTTQQDKEKAPLTLWQGVHVTVYNGNEFGITLFDAPSPDFFFPVEGEEADFELPDFGSGFTAAQISQMRREQEKKVKELTAAAKMTETEYNLMQREFGDGSIRATLDGEVLSVLTEEEARENRQPMVKVSCGGGFYVEGSVNELEKDNLKLGQEVTINDWNTGNMYTGEVCAIGDFPSSEDGWNGMGNPNASYYPFRVFIDGSADLQEGSYVSVTYSAASAENGVYLENPFLRTEGGESYVYVRGENGRLEKRIVTTGKSLWGSYTEIRSGLSEEDFVAFPYGKTVKPGAATEESDLSKLYGY